MALLELLDDRQDRGGLGLVALEAPHLQREPGTVHEQPHDDLRVHAPFLGVADLAKFVLLLGLEVEGGHVVQDQRQVPVTDGVGEASGRDLVAVSAFLSPGQAPEHRAQRRVRHTELVQHPQRVGLARGFHDPRQHQRLERLIAQGIEPQPGVRAGQHVPQQCAALAGDHRLPRRHRARAQVELALTRVHLHPGGLQQRGQLGLGVR